MAKDTDTDKPAPARIFSTSPTAIVVYEERAYDEPVIVRDEDSGKRKQISRNIGTALHVRSEMAHIEAKTAYPLDGSDPLLYGPGIAGHWGKNVIGK